MLNYPPHFLHTRSFPAAKASSCVPLSTSEEFFNALQLRLICQTLPPGVQYTVASEAVVTSALGSSVSSPDIGVTVSSCLVVTGFCVSGLSVTFFDVVLRSVTEEVALLAALELAAASEEDASSREISATNSGVRVTPVESGFCSSSL